MNLEEYLHALEDCPDEELTAELGVYDNYAIHLNAGSFADVLNHFNNDEDYRFLKAVESRREIYCSYINSKSNVIVQVIDHVKPSPDLMLNDGEEAKQHREKQENEYTLTIRLHPVYEDKREWNMRGIASAIQDIGKFVLEKRIPACFAGSVGTKYHKPYDFSRIVYHQPD